MLRIQIHFIGVWIEFYKWIQSQPRVFDDLIFDIIFILRKLQNHYFKGQFLFIGIYENSFTKGLYEGLPSSSPSFQSFREDMQLLKTEHDFFCYFFTF